jgi:hypothetical protein
MILIAAIATLFAGLWSLVVVLANANTTTGPFKGMATIVFFWGLALVLWLAVATDKAARAADMLPPEILFGKSWTPPPRSALGAFGTYSDQYLHRRWVRMCRGPERYDAMAEAYAHRRPNPCN